MVKKPRLDPGAQTPSPNVVLDAFVGLLDYSLLEPIQVLGKTVRRIQLLSGWTCCRTLSGGPWETLDGVEGSTVSRDGHHLVPETLQILAVKKTAPAVLTVVYEGLRRISELHRLVWEHWSRLQLTTPRPLLPLLSRGLRRVNTGGAMK